MRCLSEEARRALLRLARLAIVDAVLTERLPTEIPSGQAFAERCGVFVTLHLAGRLRGCIGILEGKEPLGEAVVHCAASAARQDPRFPPVRPDELAQIRIELSVLSPLLPIRPEEVRTGHHGLAVVAGGRRGVLLPQVAPENGFDREQFLSETCRKAGLAHDAWREPQTQIFGFTCEVFSEGDADPIGGKTTVA